MLRSVWLTYRLHRFEILFSALLVVLLAIAIWLVSKQMTDLNISSTCWPRNENGDYASPVCDALMQTFWMVEGSASYTRIGLAVLPPLVGLFLGVPVVAREIELRTTDLAWSLSLRRSRWLLTRLLPMLAFALVAFVVLGLLGSMLFSAIAVGRQSPDLTEVASQGPTLVARGVMALGIGVLVGSLIGRTMPALLVAAIVVLLWSVAVMPNVQGKIAHPYGVWVTQNNEGWRDGVGPIAYLDYGNFDPARPGVPGEPGLRMNDDQLQALQLQMCGVYPETAPDSSPEAQAYNDCAQGFWNDRQWSLVVPASAYPVFQNAETVLGFLIGGVALLLVFPVVARRRPG